jgi:mono/diheme cytochrome c family protein
MRWLPAVRRTRHLGPLAALALLAVACTPGAYPIDIFPEMHYEPSHRRLEPNRLAVPPGSVPVTGGKPAYTFDQAGGLVNSVPATSDNLALARATYGVNCAMCHGADAHGDSAVAAYFRGAGVVPPVDLAGARVRGRSDGQLYWLITNGIGNMPPFHDLLTEEEVWSLVSYIRSLQGP